MAGTRGARGGRVLGSSSVGLTPECQSLIVCYRERAFFQSWARPYSPESSHGSVPSQNVGIHPGRVVGGDHHYRRVGQHVAARRGGDPGVRPSRRVQKQPQATWPGRKEPRRGTRLLSILRVGGELHRQSERRLSFGCLSGGRHDGSEQQPAGRMALQPPPLCWPEQYPRLGPGTERQRLDDQRNHHSLLGRADIHLSEPTGGRGLSRLELGHGVQCRYPRRYLLVCEDRLRGQRGIVRRLRHRRPHGEQLVHGRGSEIQRRLLSQEPGPGGRHRRDELHDFRRRKVHEFHPLCRWRRPVRQQQRLRRLRYANKPLGAAAIAHRDPNPTNPTGGRHPAPQAGIVDDPAYRFGSNHAAGFYAAYCDGSVHLLSFTIDSGVLYYLGRCSSKPSLTDQQAQQLP